MKKQVLGRTKVFEDAELQKSYDELKAAVEKKNYNIMKLFL
ncbi:hypothetical protein ACFL1B_02790 [Nanoarchaeota archaeon]